MMNKEYIIKFKDKFIKNQFYSSTFIDWNHIKCWHKPVLVKKSETISRHQIHTTKESAEEVVDKIITSAKNIVKIYKKYIKNNSPYLGSSRIKHKTQLYAEFIKRDNYEICEYTPEFTYKKSKSTKTFWKDTAKSKDVCNVCGVNIIYKDYLKLANYNICPFCAKNIGDEAAKKIEEYKKVSPNVETDYITSIFVECL